MAVPAEANRTTISRRMSKTSSRLASSQPGQPDTIRGAVRLRAGRARVPACLAERGQIERVQRVVDLFRVRGARPGELPIA